MFDEINFLHNSSKLLRLQDVRSKLLMWAYTITYKTFGDQLFWSLKLLFWSLNGFCDKINFVTKKVTKSASRKVFSDKFLKMSLKITISDQFYNVTKCLILQD